MTVRRRTLVPMSDALLVNFPFNTSTIISMLAGIRMANDVVMNTYHFVGSRNMTKPGTWVKNQRYRFPNGSFAPLAKKVPINANKEKKQTGIKYSFLFFVRTTRINEANARMGSIRNSGCKK